MKTHPVVRLSPLNTRDAFYGGGTEAMRLHYKIRNGEENAQYVDVNSFYPYVCKYFKFPVGHPVIHVGDMSRQRGYVAKRGIDKKLRTATRRLYHPVLPFVCNNKLFFCLCNSCPTECNSDGKCAHETVAARALTGTWVNDEVRVAVQKGYRVIEIF